MRRRESLAETGMLTTIEGTERDIETRIGTESAKGVAVVTVIGTSLVTAAEIIRVIGTDIAATEAETWTSTQPCEKSGTVNREITATAAVGMVDIGGHAAGVTKGKKEAAPGRKEGSRAHAPVTVIAVEAGIGGSTVFLRVVYYIHPLYGSKPKGFLFLSGFISV